MKSNTDDRNENFKQPIVHFGHQRRGKNEGAEESGYWDAMRLAVRRKRDLRASSIYNVLANEMFASTYKEATNNQ
jgi:hypothetical protein